MTIYDSGVDMNLEVVKSDTMNFGDPLILDITLIIVERLEGGHEFGKSVDVL